MSENKYYKVLQEMMLLMKQNPRKKEIMTADEVCDYLGFSKSYLYKLTSQKYIPHYKPLNKIMFFKRSEIDSWIMAHPVNTIDELLERNLIPLKRRIK